jgi:hypothetical protein
VDSDSELNLVVLAGRLATAAAVTDDGRGSVTLECLITVRSDRGRKRIDVIRVVQFDPSVELVSTLAAPGVPVLVVGSLQRHLHAVGPASPAAGGSRSRLQVVADGITVRRPAQSDGHQVASPPP